MDLEPTLATHTYKIADRCEIHLDVHNVPGGTPRPAILWLHGGGLILGSRRMLPADQAQRYLEAGFAILAADYRLAPQAKVAEIVADVVDACRWIRNRGDEIGVDADRMAVVGHSAGGYLALSVAACLNPSPKAVVSFYGYGDISGAWANQPNPIYCQQGMISETDAYEKIGGKTVSFSSVEARLKTYLYCRQQGTWASKIVGEDFADPELVASRYCPIHAISPAYPPTLLLHGDRDIDVPVSESLAFGEALSRAGVPHQKIILPGYDHGFDTAGDGIRDPQVAQAFAAVLAFLQRYV